MRFPRSLRLTAYLALATTALSAAPHLFVSPRGQDTGDGSAARPFATLGRAQTEVRRLKSGAAASPITVELAAGTYRLAAPLVFSAADSGRPAAPITYAAAPGAVVKLTGSVALQPQWTPFRDGILQTPVPAGVVFDQLFVDSTRQVRARFPNFNAANPLRDGPGYTQITGGTNKRPDQWVSYNPATFSPREWKTPTTGLVHGFQSHNWGNLQYRLASVDRTQRLRTWGGVSPR
ncbi:MAG: hypothetical protein NTX09_05650, partial [Verrucomicrobia bacterium]|nr:hypothetical protein [Verrucomicrobiota bacterium]